MVDRIQLILKVNNLTASRFADEIGVQRSSISHILSGRNMPSLDLIQKVLKRYPEIDPDWLLNGRGSMIKNPQPDLFSTPEPLRESPKTSQETVVIPPVMEMQKLSLFADKEVIEEKMPVQEVVENPVKEVVPEPIQEKAPEIELKPVQEAIIPPVEKQEAVKQPVEKQQIMGIPPVTEVGIEKIVIFYTNRTFREYFPESDR